MRRCQKVCFQLIAVLTGTGFIFYESDGGGHFVVSEHRSRLALMDFLRGLVEFDPVKRWSPMQVVV